MLDGSCAGPRPRKNEEEDSEMTCNKCGCGTATKTAAKPAKAAKKAVKKVAKKSAKKTAAKKK